MLAGSITEQEGIRHSEREKHAGKRRELIGLLAGVHTLKRFIQGFCAEFD